MSDYQSALTTALDVFEREFPADREEAIMNLAVAVLKWRLTDDAERAVWSVYPVREVLEYGEDSMIPAAIERARGLLKLRPTSFLRLPLNSEVFALFEHDAQPAPKLAPLTPDKLVQMISEGEMFTLMIINGKLHLEIGHGDVFIGPNALGSIPNYFLSTIMSDELEWDELQRADVTELVYRWKVQNL